MTLRNTGIPLLAGIIAIVVGSSGWLFGADSAVRQTSVLRVLPPPPPPKLMPASGTRSRNNIALLYADETTGEAGKPAPPSMHEPPPVDAPLLVPAPEEVPLPEGTIEMGETIYLDDGTEYVEGIYGEPCFGTVGSRCWIRGDYMLWWTKGMDLPPLVTTSPIGAPPGVLGEETTGVLFGGTVNDGMESEFRGRIGYWLDPCHTAALEAEYLGVNPRSARYLAVSGGDPILARPFYDVVRDIPSSQIIALPGTAVGTIQVRADERFNTAGFWYRRNLCRTQPGCVVGCGESVCSTGCGEEACFEEIVGCGPSRGSGCAPAGACGAHRIDLLLGYRYYGQSSTLGINESVVSVAQGGQVAVGTMFDIRDTFRATNDFHGFEIGLESRHTRGPWSLDLSGKVALGNNHETVTIDGSTVITVPGQTPAVHDGGLLALPTNMGSYSRNHTVLIPQLGAELGYQWSCNLRAYVGYTLIYWDDAVLAASQIDTGINPSQLPPGTLVGPARPAFTLQETSYWAQGINLGLEYHY